MNKLTHQICIVGAGPVGLALANCLALSPHIKSIALIDKKLPKPMPSPYSQPNQRVYSINSPTLSFLQRIGALSKVRQFGKINSIQVMSKQSESFVEWQQTSAKIIENDELVNSLLLNLQESKGGKIEFIESQIQSFHNDDYGTCAVKLQDRQLHTKLLVGSDGNRSKVKELSGIGTYGWNYRQKAIACTLAVDPQYIQENHQAFQIYHEGNILGILPLWKNYLSIVWSLELPDFEHTMKMKDQDFVQHINSLISQTNSQHKHKKQYRPIPKISGITNKRLAFPLCTLQADLYTKHRLAIIGEAAHSIHPMAGLGVNSGILDGVMLANNIILNKKTGNDIGQAISLTGYEEKSKAMNYGNSIALEAIKKGFQIDFTPINMIRKNCLAFLQESSTLKSSMRKLVEQNPLVDITKYEWQK